MQEDRILLPKSMIMKITDQFGNSNVLQYELEVHEHKNNKAVISLTRIFQEPHKETLLEYEEIITPLNVNVKQLLSKLILENEYLFKYYNDSKEKMSDNYRSLRKFKKNKELFNKAKKDLEKTIKKVKFKTRKNVEKNCLLTDLNLEFCNLNSREGVYSINYNLSILDYNEKKMLISVSRNVDCSKNKYYFSPLCEYEEFLIPKNISLKEWLLKYILENDKIYQKECIEEDYSEIKETILLFKEKLIQQTNITKIKSF